ncbi:FMN-binding negative transcriptional regulator [Amycolatopsis sp. NPDC051071]|uniref:FMN-binding negative transcriptional regulator n=1 Tax=Amycolatopsis sp. NPDC051071 TaxID=3154637 RepID=UPI0034175A87
MFVPHHYREPNGTWMVDVLRGNPLALMLSNGPGDGEPFATHLPVIPDPEMEGEWADDLTGGLLLGHMNRANPQWKSLEDGQPVVVIFTGPHAYISPAVYEVTPAAPTWNFTSVHAHGVLHKVTGMEPTLEVVKATVRAFEADFGTGWDMEQSLNYFRQIAPAVGAFRIAITKADGMFKLSQEQKPEVRDRVVQNFAERDSARHRATAKLMTQLP